MVMVAGEKVIDMKNSATWIVILGVVVVLAILSGVWAIDMALKIVLYVILAAVAVWAVMMLMRAMKGGTHTHGHV
jgi:uncharacterized membrane protein